MSYLKTYLPYLFGNKKHLKSKLPEDLSWGSLSFEETLMFHALKGTLANDFLKINPKLVTREQAFQIFNFKDFLPQEFFNSLCELHRSEYELYKRSTNAKALSTQDLQDVLDFNSNRLTLYAIVPTNRRHLGKLLIKKSNGEFVKDECGNIWSISILAASGRGLAFHHSNGQTPMGVYSIDGVMPLANKNYEFGSFRRLIVNFILTSAKEENILKLLPLSQKHKAWWAQSVFAREFGRSLLRIHGTGRVNKNPFVSFFPFVPTSGCIATNEASFGIFKAQDQRKLLDAMMDASNLEVTFENEVKLDAVLFVVEYNDTFDKLIFN